MKNKRVSIIFSLLLICCLTSMVLLSFDMYSTPEVQGIMSTSIIEGEGNEFIQDLGFLRQLISDLVDIFTSDY